MADIKLDSEGDLFIDDDGSLVLVEGDDAIAQHLAVRFRFIFKEWFLDQRIGVPMFEEILIKNPDLSLARALYNELILTTPGIASLETFSLMLSADRKLSITFRAKTTSGSVLDFTDAFFIIGDLEELDA